MSTEQLQILITAAGISIVTAILSGKAIRRILLLPFQFLARKTETKQDDIIVDEVERDLGIQKDPREEK